MSTETGAWLVVAVLAIGLLAVDFAELERTRAEFERAERDARTYLVGQGVLDQTQVDLVAAFKRSDRKAE